jgi:hypothetical protein
VDLSDFLNLVFACLTSENPASAIISLFDNYLSKSLQDQPMLVSVMNLIQCLIKKSDFSMEIPGFINLVAKSMKIEGDTLKEVNLVS